MLDRRVPITVREAGDKEALLPGHVYLAPGGYHALVEREGTISLSVDAPVRYARPSADVLFESAAQAYRGKVLALVLTGANDDGAWGAGRVKAAGGTVIVQDPATALAPDMPKATLAAVPADHCVAPERLPWLLLRLCTRDLT
jgi:two-component system, chemotaxis family, protein-glutamate methylesterase/glutaminase